MKYSQLNQCVQTITDEDIVQAMKKIPGYLDITPSDFMEVYRVAFDHAMFRLKTAITADQVMTKNVFSVTETARLSEVISLMADNSISGLPVVGDNGTVAGVISEKDILKRMNTQSAASFMHVVLECLEMRGCAVTGLKNLMAKDIMSYPPVTVHILTPMVDVARTMDENVINRVPVVDDAHRLVGIIARSDLVQALC
jgi:CBS domain-containing protein